MNSFEFWSHMQDYAQMSRLWWYTFAALPAMIVAGGAYLLMVFALRRKSNLPMIFFWLLLASLPALLIFPSFYVTTNLEGSLQQVNFALPATPQDFSLATARQLGGMFDTLALYAIIGAAMTVLVMAAGSLVGDVPVASPIVQNISQSFTKAVTKAFTQRRGGTVGGAYGSFKVMKGAASGSQYAVRNGMIIGKQEADIIITDTIMSRRHARVEVASGAVRLYDERSTNGTFIKRSGQEHELNGDAFDLQPGDLIYFGPPHLPNTVEMIYERNGA